jgi:predicted nucleotidyltransferase
MGGAVEALADAVGKALLPVEAVRVAYVFGSRARGDNRADSDLDVALVYDRSLDWEGRERARRDVLSLLSNVLGRLGERADLVDLARADSAVAFRAVRDGIRVLARSDAERIAAEVTVGRRYDDDGPKRALFQRAAARLAASWVGDGRS